MEMLDDIEYFGEQEAGLIIKRLLSAVSYLHKEGIIHRDLKPENIMLNWDKCPENIKVIDFGESLFHRDDVEYIKEKQRGTVYYMAPELMQGKGKHNEKCDIWSIGVIAYLLLSGSVPFYGDSVEEI